MNTQPPVLQPHENYSLAVRNLQTYLRQLAYLDPRIPLVPIDGIYASTTREAVEAFQQINRLPVTGVVDPQTWDLLYREYLDSIDRHAPPMGIAPFPREPYAYEIISGEESDLVGILHYMLSTLAQYYDDLGDIPQSRLYAGNTERAIRNFQATHNLPTTGRVDILTWNALAREYNRIVGQNQ